MGGWISDVKSRAKISVLAPSLGLTVGRMNSIGPCPCCNEARRGDRDARGPIGFDRPPGTWKCYRCEAKGDVLDLISCVRFGDRLSAIDAESKSAIRAWCEREGLATGDTRSPVRMVRPKQTRTRPAPRRKTDTPARSGSGFFDWKDGEVERCVETLWSDSGVEVRRYLTDVRRFSEQTIRDWSLGAKLRTVGGKVVERWLTIPLRDDSGITSSIRFRSVDGDCLRCEGSGCEHCKDGKVRKAYRVAKGQTLPLFGSHLLGANVSKPVIILEGELDVIAAWEYGYRSNVVSGTSGASSWSDDWLDLIEQYRSFILLYDDDSAGAEGAKKVADLLGPYRCSRTRLPRNALGACLSAGLQAEEIDRAIDRSDPMLSIRFRKPGSWSGEVESLIRQPELLRGRSTTSKKLDDILGGIRPGLWVITGDTGHGKTSFATWLLLEQARSGVPVMLTSFEQRPIGTTQKLLRAEVGNDFTKVSETERREAFARLDRHPIFILDHYGDATFEDVRDAVRYSARRLGVRVALLDHLGFLSRGGGENERQRIEEIIRSLATVAVQDEVTILLICHPNRLAKAQQRRVQISDLKGASAIEQDAHVGIVVERLPPAKDRPFPTTAINLDKVRSEFGSPGARQLLAYDPLACVYGDSWEETPAGRRGMKIVVAG